MSFQDFLSGALAAMLFGGAKPFLCNFETGHHVKHSCEVI